MKLSVRKEHTLLLLLAFLLLAILRPPALLYPQLKTSRPDGLRATYLRGGYESGPACTDALDSLRRLAISACSTCRLEQQGCLARLDAEQGDWLSVVALEQPSARVRNGVVVYAGTPAALVGAQQACRSLSQVADAKEGPILCYPSAVPRPRAPAAAPDRGTWSTIAVVMLGALLSTWLVCGWLVRNPQLHAHVSMDDVVGGPQKFHAVPTPRIGGVPIFIGLLIGGLVLGLISLRGERGFYARLLLASLPAFAGGLIEDLTKQVGVLQRLLLTMAAGALAAWLLGAVLPRLAIPGLDQLLKFYPVAILVTIVAVGGLANAFNIIDGYNGLASGTALIVLLGLTGLALKVGDVLILRAALLTAAAVLGFLVWNWPCGRIFLGDGGAYLLGFLLAELGVLLVMRNPSISPWCPMMLMAHPVTETLYSIWRRRVHRGHHPGHPDALHLHQLIYSRLVRHAVGSPAAEDKLGRNSGVAIYFWVPALVLALLIQFFWDSSRYPVGITLAYAGLYVLLYRRIATWRAPRWLFRRSAGGAWLKAFLSPREGR